MVAEKVKDERRKRTGEARDAARRSFTFFLPTLSRPRSERGFTLIELVMTLTVLVILTLGVIPLVKVSVRRQREQRLREALREMRTAIEEFHRDTVGMQCTGATATAVNGPIPNPVQNPGQAGAGGAAAAQAQMFIDPRSKVVISDCTIFGVDNPDHYPPDLDALVNGVNVIPRAPQGQLGGAGLTGSDRTATELGETSTKKKIYLRAIPSDPITGEADWCLRSSYESGDSSTCSGGENVFDVRSKSTATALNGEKYNEW
jgi:general secretion pathway protein G